MSPLLELNSQVYSHLCWTLLHSCWQVAILFCTAYLLESYCLRRNARRTYGLYVTALIASLVAIPLTFIWISATGSQSEISIVASTPTSSKVLPAVQKLWSDTAEDPSSGNDDRFDAPVSVLAEAQIVEKAANELTVAGPVAARLLEDPQSCSAPMQSSLTAWLSLAYLCGVIVMSLRIVGGALYAQRLTTVATYVDSGPIATILVRMASERRFRSSPRIAISERVSLPLLVGLLRPVILLPPALVEGLTTTELELLLRHELAHVVRRDMWVHLLQRIAEVVMFFNPTLWLLSRRISALREHCCDEWACETSAGDSLSLRVQYSQMLVKVVRLSGAGLNVGPLHGLAATGRSPSELRRRIARLLGEPVPERIQLSRGGVMALLALATLLVVPLLADQEELADHGTPSISASQDQAAILTVTEVDEETTENELPPSTIADVVVAAARQRSFGLGGMPRVVLGGSSVEEQFLQEAAPVNVTLPTLLQWHNSQAEPAISSVSQVALAWNDREWLICEQNERYAGSSAHFRWRDQHWQLRDLGGDGRYFDRHHLGANPGLVDGFQLYDLLRASAEELLKPGNMPPDVWLEPVERTRYQWVGTESWDGALCDVYDGPQRREQLWIEQGTGLIKALYRYPDRLAYYRHEVEEIAGRTFDTQYDYHAWAQRQLPQVRAELEAHWKQAHLHACLSPSLIEFSDYREAEPGVVWPYRCEQTIISDIACQGSELAFNSARRMLEWQSVSIEGDFLSKLAAVLPREGDKVSDYTASESMLYRWPAPGREFEIDQACQDLDRLRTGPVSSTDEALGIIRQAVSCEPVTPWAKAIHYLADHPSEAVPALIEELDQARDDHVIRKLAFAMRAVGDVRAVPALIRAIPRTLLPTASDFSVDFEGDEDLLRFMQQNDLYPDNSQQRADGFGYGRAVREVTGALRLLTGQDFGEKDLYALSLRQDADQRHLQRVFYDRVARRWAAWWEEHGKALIDDPAYAEVHLPVLDSIFVPSPAREQFPVGETLERSAGVVGLTLRSSNETTRECFLDLDTGRKGVWPTELGEFAELGWDSPVLRDWARAEGFDLICVTVTPEGETEPLYCLLPLGMRVWQISEAENRRLEQSLRGDIPYPLEKPVEVLIPRRKIDPPYDEFSGDSFLFITHEGAAGVICMTAQVTKKAELTGQPAVPSGVFRSAGFALGAMLNYAIFSDAALAKSPPPLEKVPTKFEGTDTDAASTLQEEVLDGQETADASSGPVVDVLSAELIALDSAVEDWAAGLTFALNYQKRTAHAASLEEALRGEWAAESDPSEVDLATGRIVKHGEHLRGSIVYDKPPVATDEDGTVVTRISRDEYVNSGVRFVLFHPYGNGANPGQLIFRRREQGLASPRISLDGLGGYEVAGGGEGGLVASRKQVFADWDEFTAEIVSRTPEEIKVEIRSLRNMVQTRVLLTFGMRAGVPMLERLDSEWTSPDMESKSITLLSDFQQVGGGVLAAHVRTAAELFYRETDERRVIASEWVASDITATTKPEDFQIEIPAGTRVDGLEQQIDTWNRAAKLHLQSLTSTDALR